MYSAQNVRVAARDKVILDDVSIAVPRGEIVCVIGPNGAGKSTLLKVLAGERRPDRGTVTLDEASLESFDAKALSTRRAVLPQSVNVAFPFNANEIVTLGLPQRVLRSEGQRLIARALHAVDMSALASRSYETLSGGERQRIQLARVLVQLWGNGGDGYLLLDEPTSSLDLPHQLLALKLARTHVAGGGGVLAIIHDVNLAIMAADEIVALKGGKVIASGAPAEIVSDALIRDLYDVEARVRGVPDGPFLLPQTISR